jgi:tRNA modification GTPase
MSEKDTIAAIATAPGRGGVGIVRVSGAKAEKIAKAILAKTPEPRVVHYGVFYADKNNAIDNGIALYFKTPDSFTGEDVLELQGHGGPVVMDMLLKRTLALGARVARAGEFSERAFLNNKIDLTQAEAIADLIAAESEEAARAAVHSLEGRFSAEVYELVEQLIRLRAQVESAFDFPEEEIDFHSDKAIAEKLDQIQHKLKKVKDTAKQGRLLKEGMTVVIVGKPNVGKSSLLNQLTGQEAAIVSDIPGTTRDIVREHIQIDGLPLHIIDTAGLRESEDVIEKEGMRRALKVIEQADRLLYINDSQTSMDETEITTWLPANSGITLIHNKIDLVDQKADITEENDRTHIYLSAKTGDGIALLRQHLKQCMGYEKNMEGKFIARRRHIEALADADKHLAQAHINLHELKAGELLAEELKQTQLALSSITGEFSSDDLLGRIFSDFCIGK